MQKKFPLLVALSVSAAFGGPSMDSTVITPEEEVARGDSPVAIRGGVDYWGPMDLDNGIGSYELSGGFLRSPIAGQAGDAFSWGIELGLEYLRFDIDNSPTALLDDMDLWDVGLTFQAIWNYPNSAWSPFVRFNPSIASDFSGDLTSDDFRLSGIVGAFYQVSPTFKWMFAVSYQENFEEAPVIPFVGFAWQPTDVLNVNLLGPRLNVVYSPCDSWRLGLFAAANSRNWNYDTGGQSLNLEVNSARAGVSAAYKIADRFWLTAETGVSFFNSVEVLTNGGRGLYGEDADTGYFANIGFRIPF